VEHLHCPHAWCWGELETLTLSLSLVSLRCQMQMLTLWIALISLISQFYRPAHLCGCVGGVP